MTGCLDHSTSKPLRAIPEGTISKLSNTILFLPSAEFAYFYCLYVKSLYPRTGLKKYAHTEVLISARSYKVISP